MPDWRVKAVTQRAIARMPASDRVNYAMQRWVTRTAVLRPWFAERKLTQAARHYAHWARWSGSGDETPPGRVVEVGTGWFPLVTVGLALTGCREVLTVDRTALLRPRNVAATLRLLDAGLADGSVAALLGRVDPDRRAVLAELARAEETPAARLAELGIRVVVGDAAALPLPDGSCDLFVSNNTFEHIPADALLGVLREFRRLSSSGSCMSHFIDMSDHYSHFDSSISPLNFLRFDEREWRRWDNGIVPQNRLRVSDYRALHEQAGFRIVEEDVTYAEGGDVDRVPLAQPFAGRPLDDVRATYAWMVSRPAG